jgi:hypothetical protein
MTTIEELQIEMDILFEQAENGMSSNEFLLKSNELKKKFLQMKKRNNRYYYIPLIILIGYILKDVRIYIKN